MKNDKTLWIYILMGGIILLASQGCAPIFSEVQTARMVGKGEFQATPSYSSMYYKDSEYDESIQRNAGIQLVYGISEHVDFRLRYERLWFAEGEIAEGFDIIGFGPKIRLIEDKLAANIILGRALGEDTEETWEAQLSLLGTIPLIKEKLDFTIAPKLVLPLAGDGGESLSAVNFNLAISENLDKWAIIPEYGILFKVGEEGHYGQFSIGVAMKF